MGANDLVGDVSGKGVPAALVLASIRTMFRMMTSERRELAYVNAGQPAGIVLRALTPRCDPLLLARCGPPAGLFADQKYRTVTLRVPEDAVGILVTDGITEALDILGSTNGDPVASLIAHVPEPFVPRRICDALIERTASALSSDWEDDRTVVAFALDSGTDVSSSVLLP